MDGFNRQCLIIVLLSSSKEENCQSAFWFGTRNARGRKVEPQWIRKEDFNSLHLRKVNDISSAIRPTQADQR